MFLVVAPEILAGEPYGHAIDWWALGVLACRMYTGEYPQLDLSIYLNKSEDIDKLIGMGKSKPRTMSNKLLPASCDELPAEAQDLLRRLLETKPQYRLRSLLQLQRIALYKNYDWDCVRKKQINPRQLMIDGDRSVNQDAGGSFEFDW